MAIKASDTSLQRGMCKLYLKQTEIQLYKSYASKAHDEVDVKNLVSHHAKRNEIHGVCKLGLAMFIFHHNAEYSC